MNTLKIKNKLDNKMNIVHATNPFDPREKQIYTLPKEATIQDFVEEYNIDFNRPTVCIVNGEDGLLRNEYKDHLVGEYDSIVFVTLPEGGGGSNPIMIILTLVLIYFTGGLAAPMLQAGYSAGVIAATQAAVMMGGMALIGAIVPPPKIPSTQQQSLGSVSPVYSIGAQGNTTRIGASIPEVFGTHRIYPDLAAAPYTDYEGNEQYLYQLFCIGQGNFDIYDTKIGDSLIENFEEVETQIVQPGGTVTLFPTNVESNSEIIGQDMLENVYIGGFVANVSGTQTNRIAIDIVCARGLFEANDDGGLDVVTIAFDTEIRLIDDSGVPLAGWVNYGNRVVNEATQTPVRRSFSFVVPLGRYEVRIKRTTAKLDSNKVADDMGWTSLKAYIPGTQSYGDVTMMAVKIRASNNVSSQSSKQINIKVGRKIESWNSTTGWSGTESVTSSPSWILAHICKTVLDENRYSLQDLEDLNDNTISRNTVYDVDDEFNGVFDNRMSFWESIQLVSKTIRAMPIVQGGVIRFVRDDQQGTITSMFTMRNIIKDTFNTTYVMPGEDTADSVEVEYFDADSLKPKIVLSEISPGNSTKLAKVKLFGVTTHEHAYREGMYYAAANKYRRTLTTFETELEGHIPSIGDLIGVSHDMPNWGHSGELIAYEEYDAITWKLTLSEPVEESQDTNYIVLRRKDGSPTDPIVATIYNNEVDQVLILKAYVDFTMNVSGDYEKTFWSFGVASKFYQRCRVIAPMRVKGKTIQINVVNENDLVHNADGGIPPELVDQFELPPPIQKPVINSLNVVAGGTPQHPQLFLSWTPAENADHYIIEWRTSTDTSWTRAGESHGAEFTLMVSPNVIDVRVAAVGIVQGIWISTTIDAKLIAIPGDVPNVRLLEAFTGTQVSIIWDVTARTESYKIEVRTGGVLKRTNTTTSLEYTYRSEDSIFDGGPFRTIDFTVYGVNESGQSEVGTLLQVTNAVPPQLTQVVLYSGYGQIMIKTEIVQDTDFAGYVVHMETYSGFSTGPANIVYEGNDTLITIPDLIIGTPYYFRIAAYDDFGKDNLNYSVEYTKTPVGFDQVEITPEQVLTLLNEQLDTTSDTLILSASQFAVEIDVGGTTKTPFIIGTIEGDVKVGISADTYIHGTLSANQLTSGSINAGTDISVGNGSMVLDGEGSLVVYDGDNTQSNRDFAFLNGGDLEFQRYRDGQYYTYKSVKRAEYGTASSGATITLPGYWDLPPKLIVSPYALKSYDFDTNGQSQSWKVEAANIRETFLGSQIYEFDSIAELTLSNSEGTEQSNENTTTSGSWNSTVTVLPANIVELTVNVQISTKRGTGTSSNIWNNRQVAWKVYYWDSVLLQWFSTSFNFVFPGNNLDIIQNDSITIALPANISHYYAHFEASDLATDFTNGAIIYDYINHTTSNVNSVVSIVSTDIDDNQHFTAQTAVLDLYSPPVDYLTYQVRYQWTSVIDNLTAKWWSYSGVTDTLGVISNAGVSNYIVTTSTNRDVTYNTSTYDRNYITTSGEIWFTKAGSLSTNTMNVKLNTCSATLYMRKILVNSTSAINMYEVQSYSYVLSGSTALATGSINWLAIEA